MTTRTPPTDDDIAGRSERGRAAYNERRAMLAARGISIPDIHGADELDDESDPSGAQRFWRSYAIEEAKNIAVEREWARQDERIRQQFGGLVAKDLGRSHTNE